MIAYCGLNCIECGACEATQNDDDGKRSEVATIGSKVFKADIRPEQINCGGCQSADGRLFSRCEVYGIRELDFIFDAEPDAKKLLDGINAGL